MPKDLEGEGQSGRHPAYGVIQLGRSQSSSNDVMFGSTMRSSYKMTLSIHAASIRHSLGKDHIFAEEEIIEVAMTSDQLGRMMSSVGMAEGVPCTILRRDMRRVPDPPAIPTEQQRIQDAFDAKMQSMARDLRGHLPEIMAILDKEGAINKGDREALRNALAMLHQEVASNAGFAMHQFQGVGGAGWSRPPWPRSTPTSRRWRAACRRAPTRSRWSSTWGRRCAWAPAREVDHGG